jgi:hypothetical protein
VNKLLRSLLMIILVVALPLQGQAAALMTCHGLKTVHDLGATEPHVYAAVDHGQHQGPLEQDAAYSYLDQAEHTHSALEAGQAETGGTSAASCALCSAFCTMATGLSRAVGQPTLDFRPPPLPQTTPPVYVGVVLDGLLRPPRA